MNAKLVILFTSIGSNLTLKKNTAKIEQWFSIKRFSIEYIDGADPESQQLRNRLFEISGIRTYPQVFKYKDNEYTFIGDYKYVEDLIENEQFDSVTKDIARY